MEIKAIVFDIGGVLVFEDGAKHREIFCKKMKLDIKEFSKIVIPQLKKSYKGKLNARDFFENIRVKLGSEKSSKEMVNTWLKIRKKKSKINRVVRRLIKKLDKKYLIVAFTNSTILNDRVRKDMKVYDLFNVKLISYREGKMKSEVGFYELLLRKMKIKNIMPSEILYIDDKKEYTNYAKCLGMKAILYTNNKKLKKDLKKFEVF